MSDVEPSPRLTLVAPREATEGGRIRLALRIENPGDAPLDLYLRGRDPTADVVVTRADGTVAWERLRGAAIQAVLQLRTLAPREALTVRMRWDLRGDDRVPLAPGEYALRAILLTDVPGGRAAPAVPLRIVPR